jgi:hypothetical protein
VEVVQGQRDLLEVIQALSPPGCSTSGLNSRKQNCQKDSNNGDDHKQFDQGEP